jgi:hypothetical protein
MITYRGATLDPRDELRKLTASLLTPTIKSKIAKRINNTIAMKNNSIPILAPENLFENNK